MEKNKKNKKGKPHGYWERKLYDSEIIMCKGYYNNGERHGYWEWYWQNGKVYYKGCFNNGERTGYWEWYDNDGEITLQMFHT